MIGRTVGNYRIVEKLGEGGMGSVFRGIDQMVERSVAIKVLKPGLTTTSTTHNRFLSEAKALAKLNHPAIAMLYSFFLEGDEYFMVMEYVPGQNLETLIRTHGAIRWPQAVSTLTRILDGMGHAHAQGIIHRDLKPANIMLSFNGDVKITDFGIARVFFSPKITRESRVVGTMEYLAPERALGKEADERTDIYSLGVILYEMLTGRLPFEGHSEYELIRAQVEQPPKPLGELGVAVPAAVEQALMTALEKDPAKRHADTQAFAAQLRAALARDVAPALRPMTSETIETQTSSSASKDLPPAPSSGTLPLPAVKSTPAAAPPAASPAAEVPPAETAAPAPPVSAASEPPAPKKPARSIPWPAFLAKWPLEVRAAVAGGVLVLVIIIAGVSFWQRAERRKADAARLRAAQTAASPAPAPDNVAVAPPTEPAPAEPVPDAVPAPPTESAAPPDPAAKPKVAARPANPHPAATLKVLPAQPADANTVKPAAPVSVPPEPVQPEPTPVSAPAPPKAEEPPPPPAPGVQKLADVKSVYLTPMPEKLDARLRQEIENEFKGRLRVAADAAGADAVMTVVIEDEHGNRISGAAGKLSEVKGTRHAIAALRDHSGSRQLWTASVDDKHSFVGSLGDDVKRLASRLAKRLHVDLH